MNNFERDVANEMLDKADARIAQLEKARDLSAEASATMRDESIAKSERIARLESAYAKAYARVGQLEAALRKVETFMMIVEPRSHKAEYINMLASVRSVLPPYALENEVAK